MKSLANNWLEFAHKDLQAASQIVSNAELTALTAFHCEQCIEKSFKAILASYEKPPPRAHDLVTLHTQVEELISFPVNEATLREVSDTYTESRYPLGRAPLPAPFQALAAGRGGNDRRGFPKADGCSPKPCRQFPSHRRGVTQKGT